MSGLEAVLLDAGGVLILPDPVRIRGALSSVGLEPDDDTLARCHYAGMRALDMTEGVDWSAGSPYLRAYAVELGIDPATGIDPFEASLTGAFWTHAIESSLVALRVLERRGTPIVVVSNSGGEVENELALAGVCQVGSGPGVRVMRVVDSSVVGARKPDPAIFEIALETLGLAPADVVHIGDSVRFDVNGARAARIRPIHLDPFGFCPDDDHEHIASLEAVLQLL